MKASISLIPGGGVTSPRGFLAGAVSAGIKIEKGTRLDLGILRSEVPGTAAAVFSRNKVKAAPVVLCQQHLKKGRVAAVVINSGYANSCTGKQGMADALEMAVALEENACVFYLDVAQRSESLLAIIPGAFKRVAKKRGKRKAKLESLLDAAGASA